MSGAEYDKKRWVKNNALLELKRKFEARDNKHYKIKSIVNSVVYDKEAESKMSSLYYLVLWKSYLKEKSSRSFQQF